MTEIRVVEHSEQWLRGRLAQCREELERWRPVCAIEDEIEGLVWLLREESS